MKTCAVMGVGPGNGEAFARRFAAAGYRVAITARSADKLTALAAEIDALAVPCDVTDLDALRGALRHIADALGPIDTLLWNVGSGVFGDMDQVDVDALELAWRTNALGLFVAAKEVAPAMREAGAGNILVTGATASLRGKPFTTAFAAGKAAQRSLAQSLARSLWPQGIHVALVIVDGMIDLPRTRAARPDLPDEALLDPDAVAHTMLHLATQPRRAWTFECEVRPHIENW